MKLKNLIPTSWSPLFATELENVAQRLGTDPDYILSIIKLESNFNLQAYNSVSYAVGLIQWMPSTLQGLGYSTNDVFNMDELAQLQLIERYYTPYKGFDLNDPLKLFAVAFYPVILYHWNDNGWVIGSEKSDTYARTVATQNYLFDTNQDSYITLREYKKYIRNELKKNGLIKTNTFLYIGGSIIGLYLIKKMKKR